MNIFNKKIKECFQSNIISNYIITCIPKHVNVGDNLIYKAELQFLSNVNKKMIKKTFTPLEFDNIDNNILIVFHGGGNFGDIWTNIMNMYIYVIKYYPDNNILFLPNSMWFNSNEYRNKIISIFKKHRGNITFCHRELQSYLIGLQYFPFINNILVPDTVLGMTLNNDTNQLIEYNTLYISRNDCEKKVKYNILCDLISDWPTYNSKSKYLIKTNNVDMWELNVLDNIINDGINFITKSNIVYSDRMHGAILSWILGKETYLIDNSYGKSSSLYKTWLKDNTNIKLL